MEYFAGSYDVAVVGGGHAGCEAALASARLGAKTILFTINLDAVGNMPCNPNIGGTGKGHLVREIDALGGEMAKAADANLTQIRLLNTAKGPAVYSLRAQIDRRRYQDYMKRVIEKTTGLELRQSEIWDIRQKEDKTWQLVAKTGAVFESKTVILTTGTYLQAKIIIGDYSFQGGPDGMFAATGLSESMKNLGIRLFRFKTGTPCRVDRRSINFSKMEIQEGDPDLYPFSFDTPKIEREQVPCYLTWTNAKTHDIIRRNIHRSPLYSGDIKGIGARYCPSIEDKIMRFPDRERHQVFIEPMGTDTFEMYVQGMSSSLPEDVQQEMLRSVEGMEQVRIMRTGYAIEYDCIDSLQLKHTLEYHEHEGLFSAGQINGTSGYEEAGAQGLVAGINAVRKIRNQSPFIIDRSEAYIGVLIDDLVTTGADEPYRMMTSRSEYRLLLRQDNADARMIPRGYEAGLVSIERYQKLNEKLDIIKREIDRLEKTHVSVPEEKEDFFLKRNSARPKNGISLAALLRRPEIKYMDLVEFDDKVLEFPSDYREEVEIHVKYSGYIKNQIIQVEQFKKNENKLLPEDMDYTMLSGLSKESAQKLMKVRPSSIGQAARITGVTPADISVLLIELAKRNRGRQS